MKTTFLTMAALAALSVAAPAAAQNWYGQQSQSRDLQLQIDAGARSGAIPSKDMPRLRDDLRNLFALERQYSAGGFSRRETAILAQRSADLRQEIKLAERSGHYEGRRVGKGAAWEAGDGRPGANRGFDGPNRGDRFAGDVRVGQRASSRMAALPAEYRADYRDNEQVYYGYDNDRIYRVDRRTGLILGLLDLRSRARKD